MSRIHEALKKAAQERNDQAPIRTASDFLDLATPGAASAPPVDGHRPEGLTGVAPGTDARYLRFEEFAKRCSRPGWKMGAEANAFSLQSLNAIGAEKFRTLRSRLYQIAAAHPLKKLVITSAMPGEGKTFVTTNLAQSFVRQTDRRVLLIDADLRASRLHLLLGAPDRPGLSDYLRGDADECQVTQVGPSGNLCLIPGGQEITNPSELMHSDRMRHLLERMSQVFDWVILDSPPAMAVHDSSILADMCDGVIFVVRAGSTDFEIAQKASSEFRDKNLLGVVLNRVEKGDSYNDYYYGYDSTSVPRAQRK
jgi:capsular exopolysaccharide synthesis family protein